MGIKIKHGKPETLLTAAQLAGQARRQEEIQKMQMEFDYRQSLRQQDMVIDLQMQERAKQWEIEKMQLRSQIDFQREEQKRQRKIDDAENAKLQIEKEIKAGKIDEKDPQVKNLLLYYELQAQSPDRAPPIGLIKPPTERAERIVTPGQRMAALKALRGEEFEEPGWLGKLVPEFLGGEPSELSPEILEEKALLKSIVRGEYAAPVGTISPGLPEPKTRAEYDAIPSGSQYIDSKGNVRTKR